MKVPSFILILFSLSVLASGNTVHSFTNPQAGNDPKAGAAYNELSAKRAMREMKAFFYETLK